MVLAGLVFAFLTFFTFLGFCEVVVVVLSWVVVVEDAWPANVNGTVAAASVRASNVCFMVPFSPWRDLPATVPSCSIRSEGSIAPPGYSSHQNRGAVQLTFVSLEISLFRGYTPVFRRRDTVNDAAGADYS